MRITKQMFDKLNKKDREEYLARKEKLGGVLDSMGFCITYIWMTLKIFLIGLVVIPLWKLAFGTAIALSFFNLLFTIVHLMGFVIWVGLIVDLGILLFYFVKLDKLKKEFFDVEVKARRR